MIDLSHLPAGADVQVFRGASTVGGGWLVWNKPRGINTVLMVGIGPGRGGGGGAAAAVGTSKGGGGGGGGGGYSAALFPASALPASLSIQVSDGGKGGASATDGASVSPNAGVPTQVCTYPVSAAQNRYLFADTGRNGTAGGGAGGAAGAGGTVMAATSCPLIHLAVWWTASAGCAGTAGTLGTAVTNTAIGTTIPILGGAGGGGYTAAGSAVAGGGFASDVPALVPSTAGGAAGASPGAGDHGLWLPPYMIGGCGGGATDTAATTGGAGGYGIAPGAGGGGGGAGVAAGGRGGDGGPGLVIIVAW